MKKQFFLFYLVSLTIYLIGGALQSAGASPHPLGRDKTHSHGVIDGWAAKRYSDQYQNRRYARSAAANLNVGQPPKSRLTATNTLRTVESRLSLTHITTSERK